jgi:hypoxanthine phosphoribosyltransferase
MEGVFFVVETDASLSLGDVLLSRDDIHRRVTELASEITREFSGSEIILVGVLKGAVIFMADLARLIGGDVDVRMDFMAVSSYGNSTTSSGAVKIVKDMDSPAEGKNIILVEDIMDTGFTLSYLKDMILARGAAKFRTCVLLEKPDRKQVECGIEYRGFSIPDKFVVGYGLDCAGKWRNLQDIWCVNEG